MTTPVPPRPPMPRWMRVVGWITGLALTAALALFGGLFFAVERTARSVPAYDAMKIAPNGRTVRIHAADGTIFQTLGPAYGEWLAYERIPDVMRRAMVSVEDRRFWSHHGVDPRALARVAWLAWERRGTDRRLQGASTITQQAARTVFLSRSYDWRRKAKEMLVAMAMERRFDKRQILALYMNRVYLGGNTYGVDAASRRFFGHPAASLTLPEAALIAGLARAPSDTAPSADPEAAYARMRVVLQTMRETGAASPADIAAAMRTRPPFAEPPQEQGNGARYFTDWVRPQIDAIVGDAVGQVEVETTFDPKLQSLGDDAVSRGVPKGAQGALVTLDSDGAIRAMVGGTDYATSAFNRVTQAARQPGSSFKLFVYLAALEAGYRPDSPVTDAPIAIGDWSPRNSTGSYMGTVPLRTAFAQSLNTVAARLGQSVGTPAIAKVARRLGFSMPISLDPAMVLGSSEAHLIDMARAYATIGSGGLQVTPYAISRITVNGREVYRHATVNRLLMAPVVAANMGAMLRNNVENGTGQAARIGRPVAGKTGTTSSGKDGLFLGYSSGLTTGVWVGRDDNRPVPDLQGGRAPARIFAAYMRKAVEGRPADEMAPAIAVDPSSDQSDQSADGEQGSDVPARTTSDDADAPRRSTGASSASDDEAGEEVRIERALRDDAGDDEGDGRSRAIPQE